MSEKRKGVATYTVPVVQLTKQGEFVKEWDSGIQAAKALDIKCTGSISSCCKRLKGYDTAGGYKWMYAREYHTSTLV